MFPVVLTWFFLSSISLAIQYWHDVREMVVDSRRNYFMFGATIMLGVALEQYGVYFSSIIAMFIWVFVLGVLEKRFALTSFGDGDKELFLWLVPGLMIIDPRLAIVYLALFSVSILTFWALNFFIKRTEDTHPGLIFITVAWLIVLWLAFV